MSEVNEGIAAVLKDARALAGVVLGGSSLDEVVYEYRNPSPYTGAALLRHAQIYYGANSAAARLSTFEEVSVLEPVTDYGRACVAAVMSGAHSYDSRNVFVGSKRVACADTEPNFVRAAESPERLGLVLVQDGVVVAAQKKTGQENTVLAFQDFDLTSELNGQVRVPMAAVFSVGKSATDGEMRVVDVGAVETQKAVVLRATTFSLPEGVIGTSEHAPWFSLPKDERGLKEIQSRITAFIA